MKIITPGRLKNKIYRAKCHHCGCEFEYDRMNWRFLPFGIFTYVTVVKCAQELCGQDVLHDDKNLVREEEAGVPILNQEEHEREQVREFLEWLSAKLDNDFLYDGPVVVQAIKDKMAEMGLK